MNMFSLVDRVALVTGGNGGIGLGMAEGFARVGARVVLSGRDKKKAEGALAALRTHGADAKFIEADVTDEMPAAALSGGGRRVRPAGHPRQQCRHVDPQARRRISPRVNGTS